MRSWIMPAYRLVPAFTNDLLIPNHYSPDGHLTGRLGLPRECQGMLHPELIQCVDL
jgi:hypothetical protein